MEGFITIRRKITAWRWYKDGNTSRLFTHLLLTANYKKTEWKGIIVKRGQVLTGRKQLAEDLDLTEQAIRTSLNNLKSTNELTSKSTNRFTIITICKYDDYQIKNQKKEVSPPTDQPTEPKSGEKDPPGNPQPPRDTEESPKTNQPELEKSTSETPPSNPLKDSLNGQESPVNQPAKSDEANQQSTNSQPRTNKEEQKEKGGEKTRKREHPPPFFR